MAKKPKGREEQVRADLLEDLEELEGLEASDLPAGRLYSLIQLLEDELAHLKAGLSRRRD